MLLLVVTVQVPALKARAVGQRWRRRLEEAGNEAVDRWVEWGWGKGWLM